jgi:primase-polymerase (primpol)-like protein
VGGTGTVTNDFRGPITNGGSATCNGLWAGSVCIADDMLLQYSSSDVIYRGQSTSASGLVYYQFLNNSAGAAGSFGFGNGSYADVDYANVLWFISNTATNPIRIGNTGNATATQATVKFTDDTSAGNGEGTNQVVVYGGGTIAFPQTQTVTCADNGGGTNAAQNLDPQAHTITVLNNDATGCDITMQETSAILGAVAVICVDPASTATNVNFADVANVFNGAAPAMSQGDCITIRYFDAANDLWLQTGASNN